MQLRTEVLIDAPPERVWAVLADFRRYGEWNPFLPSVSGKLSVGEKLEIEVSEPGRGEVVFKPEVAVVDPPHEMRWRGKLWLPSLFVAEHYFRLEPVDDGKTKLLHGEDFSGALVKVLGPRLANAVGGFAAMNQALKRRVEAASAKDRPPPGPDVPR